MGHNILYFSDKPTGQPALLSIGGLFFFLVVGIIYSILGNSQRVSRSIGIQILRIAQVIGCIRILEKT
jgi:hypothetical protein